MTAAIITEIVMITEIAMIAEITMMQGYRRAARRSRGSLRGLPLFAVNAIIY